MGSSTVDEKSKAGFRLVNGGRGGAPTLLEGMKILQEFQDQSERKKTLNSELWHACAGPLVSLPQIGSRVYYFPQGHSEQVEVSTKGIAGSHIPNYPNLPSQLMCHVQNVTLHADKDTDEIYAQMTLQPMNPEKDIFPVIDFGIRPNKHPSEFFCKTLTASDTSTHGGFSVPRRAAEKLFPSLDYSMQPPTQELVVRDLHDNSWTFRHIYRGQPKRHLLTSGWSLLLSAKRLRAGAAVLFVRDEKSQLRTLRLGVRRANRSKTTLPSSILSVDSMHIGVLAAAANRSPFTIFYNPRACPSEFVVPLVKYQKAVYGPQVSIGMRFGMMFETEESGKRRYMGMVVGISDIDPLRWPGSKWRNLQVEWDEPGRKHKRVGSWEIETPESVFVFPSLSSTLKRSLCSGFLGADTEWKSMIKKPTTGVLGNGNVDFRYPLIPSTSSELVQMLLENVNPVGAFPSTSTFFGGSSNRETQAQTSTEEKPHTLSLQNNLLQNQNPLQNFHEQLHTIESNLASNGRLSETDKCENQLPLKTHTEKPPIVPVVAQDQQRQLTSLGKCNEDISGEGLLNCQSQSLESQLLYLNQRQLQEQPGSVQQDTADLHQNFTPQMNISDLYSIPPCPGNLPSQFTVADDWISNPSSYQSLAGVLGSLEEPISGSMLQDGTLNPIVCSFGQEAWDPQLSYLRSLSHSEELSSCLQQDTTPLQSAANSCVLRDFPEESNDQSEIYSGLHFEVSNGGRAVVDLPFSGSVLDVFSSPGDVGFFTTDNCLGSNIGSTQNIQSQITTTSLGDPYGFSLQDFPDCTGGTSSRSSLDFDESSLLQKGQPWQLLSCSK